MSVYSRKRRTIAGTDVDLTLVWGPGITDSVYHLRDNNFQETWSRGNPWHSGGSKLPNVGGSFYTQLIERDLNPFTVDTPTYRGERMYGFMSCANGATTWAPTAYDITWPAGGWSTFDAMGATAISRCAPTNSHADLAVALTELSREGLPKSSLLVGAARGTSVPKRAADEWLGLNFGVLPFVSDVTDTVKAVRNSGEILRQYARDSGKLIHRTYRFPDQVSSTTSTTSGVYPYPSSIPDFRLAPFTRTRVQTTTVSTWFTGDFTYHRNDGTRSTDAIMRFAQDANHLLGLRLTPDVLWELMPFSWLVDWKTNVGDVLHNMSMFLTDGLVLVRGYVMQTTRVAFTDTMMGGSLYGVPSSRILAFPASGCTTTKVRRAANPFGFGLTSDSLSNRQWSILAALGISKGSAHTLRNETDGIW